MKKIIFIISVLFLSFGQISAQTLQKTEEGSQSLSAYKQQRIKRLPHVQAYQADNGVILKAADSDGWGVEPFVGCAYMGYFTPEIGVNARYDARWVSYRIGLSALAREYNAESVEPGKRYPSFAADAYLHVNLLKRRWHINVLSVYGNAGYLYGQHRFAVGEQELENGDILKNTVSHNGSGITVGGGLEYRCQFFATGNALTIRTGYKRILNTFVNNTQGNHMIYAQIGFNFGCARHRVRHGK